MEAGVAQRLFPARWRDTRIDERDPKRTKITHLDFEGFLEALCRVAASIQFWGSKEQVAPPDYIRHCRNIRRPGSDQRLQYYQYALKSVKGGLVTTPDLVHKLQCMFRCFQDIESKTPYEEESEEDYHFLNQVQIG